MTQALALSLGVNEPGQMTDNQDDDLSIVTVTPSLLLSCLPRGGHWSLLGQTQCPDPRHGQTMDGDTGLTQETIVATPYRYGAQHKQEGE